MRGLIAFGLVLLAASAAWAGPVDPDLQAKADAFQEFAEDWHGTGLGALTGALTFTNDQYEEIACVHHQGDSTIWTGEYLGAQAFRYMVTQDAGARDEILRVAEYLHITLAITDTLGYVARWAGPNEPPWDCGMPDGHGWKILGTGEWDGYYWVDHTSRDQYSGWWMGLTLAYDALANDPSAEAVAMRQQIREDFTDVIDMLVLNSWHITDQNGQWTGNGAHWVAAIMRLSWISMANHVTEDEDMRTLLDRQYDLNLGLLSIDTFSGLNRYMEYFGNNLRHLAYLAMFRVWPDRERLEHLWEVWEATNRPWVKETHNPFFDAVHYAGCLRLGNCDQDEVDWIKDDFLNTLGRYYDPPAYKRAVTCSTMPLDDFSVWADQFIAMYPWLESVVNINPQTADARELDDRHWTDMYWQSTPFEEACNHGEDKTYVGPGMDYLLAYWMGVYYGLLPGDGPYPGEHELEEVDDDDTADDDTDIDDDTADDDADDDWHPPADDDDDVADDDAADDDVGDDDDDDDGCGC